MTDTNKTLHSFQELKEVKEEFEKSAQQLQEERHKRYAAAKKLTDALKATYPTVFSSAKPQPLAIGIEKEIFKLHPEFSLPILKLALLLWTRREKYLAAVIAGENRYALDGSISGTIQASEKEYSQTKLAHLAESKQAQQALKKNPPRNQHTPG